MTVFGKVSLLAMALTVGGSASALAQECDINEDRPSEIGRAMLSITQAGNAQRQEQDRGVEGAEQ